MLDTHLDRKCHSVLSRMSYARQTADFGNLASSRHTQPDLCQRTTTPTPTMVLSGRWCCQRDTYTQPGVRIGAPRTRGVRPASASITSCRAYHACDAFFLHEAQLVSTHGLKATNQLRPVSNEVQSLHCVALRQRWVRARCATPSPGERCNQSGQSSWLPCILVDPPAVHRRLGNEVRATEATTADQPESDTTR